MSSTPKPPRAITAEDWDYWLGCMPPCKWQAVAGGEAFYVMELLNFDLAIWCVRLGDAHYRVDASPRLSPQQAADLVALAKSPA